jgi:hypothetical protein
MSCVSPSRDGAGARGALGTAARWSSTKSFRLERLLHYHANSKMECQLQKSRLGMVLRNVVQLAARCWGRAWAFVVVGQSRVARAETMSATSVRVV